MGDSEDSDDLANMLDDIDDLDNNLFDNLKKKGKTPPKASKPSAVSNKKVSFAEKTVPTSFAKKPSSGSDEEFGQEPTGKKGSKSSLDDLFGPVATKKPTEKSAKPAAKPDLFDMFSTPEKPKPKGKFSDSDTEAPAKKRQGMGLDDLFGPTTRSSEPLQPKPKKTANFDQIFGGSTTGSGSDTDERRMPKPQGRKVPKANVEDLSWLSGDKPDKRAKQPVSTDSDEEIERAVQKRGVTKTSKALEFEEKIAEVERKSVGFDPLALVKPKIETKPTPIETDDSKVANLLKQIEKLQADKADLESQLELQKQQHQVELEKCVDRQKADLQRMETQLKSNEQRLIEENRQLTEKLQESKAQLFAETQKLETQWRQRLAQTTQTYEEQIEQLKALNKYKNALPSNGQLDNKCLYTYLTKAVDSIKLDADETVERLRKSVSSQIEAASSAYEYTKNYTEIVSSIQSATAELKDLASKVSQLHDVGVQTKENSLKLGEDRVVYLQQKLEKELGDLNFERDKIHNLLSKLETLTREQQSTLDKDRWELKQEQSKLNTYQSAFAEEKRHIVDRIEAEKHELQRAKEIFLNEQRQLLTKVLAENEKLSRDKAEFLVRRDADITRLKQEAILLEERNRQFEAMAKSASKHKNELQLKEEEILRLEQELILEKANLERERSQIEFEKSSLYETKLRDQSMILDPALISLDMTTKRETEDVMRRYQAEIDRKLAHLKAEKDELFAKEQKLMKLFAQLADERKELNKLRETSVCPYCYNSINNTGESRNREAAERPYESPPISRLSRSNSIRRPSISRN